MIKKLLPHVRWLLRYLHWWADWCGDNRILFTGPLSVLVGAIGVVGALVATDLEYLLGAGAILLVGLIIMVGPGLSYWGKLKPWDYDDYDDY